MKTLVVLTGARGAGKSTTVEAVTSSGFAQQLKPFTTRERRDASDDEYHFKKNRPRQETVAWSIQVGVHWYGMLRTEIDLIPSGKVGLTVFEPNNLDELKRFRDENQAIEVIIIGLDTIATAEEQVERTEGNEKRRESQAQIDSIRTILRNTDVVLSGNQQAVINAVAATCRLLAGRGGIVAKSEILALIDGGCLLKGADRNEVQSASYDLRLGDEVWCQGKTTNLSADNPLFLIPAYSYAIVKAAETAEFPAFIAGQFDIRVKHFLSGVILSNGPQVDPGYRGELFCMLFNGNSEAKSIRLGDHFATLQFWTTTRNTEPYSGFYYMRNKLVNHMEPEVSTGHGGRIEEMVDQKLGAMAIQLRGEMPKDHSNMILGIMGVMVTIVFGVTVFAANAANDAKEAAATARDALKELPNRDLPLSVTPPANPFPETLPNSEKESKVPNDSESKAPQ